MEKEGNLTREYLAERLGVAAEELTVTPLGGGVSNDVVLAVGGGVRCVAKQSLGRLRVQEEWLSRRDRIHRECDALRAMVGVLPEWAAPGILFEDRERFVFGMEAAPADALPWKTELLAGEVRAEVAGVCGRLLGAWISESARRPEWRVDFGDLTVFEELRVDPYYRFTAGRHPELRERFAALIEECNGRRVSLVHGDYSPKNLLVRGARVMVIDWEVVHWGDPAFDGGFFSNHLVLKYAVVEPAREELKRAAGEFWSAVRDEAGDEYGWLEAASMKHLGCLLLARVDGKSPAEYVKDEGLKTKLRGAARELICEPAGTMDEVLERVTKWI